MNVWTTLHRTTTWDISVLNVSTLIKLETTSIKQIIYQAELLKHRVHTLEAETSTGELWCTGLRAPVTHLILIAAGDTKDELIKIRENKLHCMVQHLGPLICAHTRQDMLIGGHSVHNVVH